MRLGRYITARDCVPLTFIIVSGSRCYFDAFVYRFCSFESIVLDGGVRQRSRVVISACVTNRYLDDRPFPAGLLRMTEFVEITILRAVIVTVIYHVFCQFVPTVCVIDTGSERDSGYNLNAESWRSSDLCS